MPILVRVVDSVDKAEYNVVCVVFYMIVTYYLFHLPRHMYIHRPHPLTRSLDSNFESVHFATISCRRLGNPTNTCRCNRRGDVASSIIVSNKLIIVPAMPEVQKERKK